MPKVTTPRDGVVTLCDGLFGGDKTLKLLDQFVVVLNHGAKVIANDADADFEAQPGVPQFDQGWDVRERGVPHEC